MKLFSTCILFFAIYFAQSATADAPTTLCVPISASFKTVLSAYGYETSKATACQVPLIADGDKLFTAALSALLKCKDKTDTACIQPALNTAIQGVQNVQAKAASTCSPNDYNNIKKIFDDTLAILSKPPSDAYEALANIYKQLKTVNVGGNASVCTQISPLLTKLLGLFHYNITKANTCQAPLLISGDAALKTTINAAMACFSKPSTFPVCLQGVLNTATGAVTDIKNTAQSTCSPADYQAIQPIFDQILQITKLPVDEAVKAIIPLLKSIW